MIKFFLLSAFIFYSSHSFAAKPNSSSTMRTGYVDIMKAFESTKRGRRVKSKLENLTEKAKKEFKSTELSLQKEENKLKKDAPLLSEQGRMQRVQQLQQKIVDYQKSVKDKEVELQNLQNQLMNPVIENLKTVIGEVAKKENYLVVENIGNDVLWVDQSLNLTNKVSKEFNKKYK